MPAVAADSQNLRLVEIGMVFDLIADQRRIGRSRWPCGAASVEKFETPIWRAKPGAADSIQRADGPSSGMPGFGQWISSRST